MLQNHLLSLLIWWPMLGALPLLFLNNEKYNALARWSALFVALVGFALCIPLYHLFDLTTSAMQFTEHFAWIPAYGIHYDLGVDGISMPLIVLTAFTTIIVILAGWKSVQKNVAFYMASFLLMQGMMIGTFAALDGILFYVFWEILLIPMYLIIGVWGSSNRTYAAIKFFLYTFFGSAMMLISLLYLGFKAHTFSILTFQSMEIGLLPQVLIFLTFFLAFAVKVPMWPVHTWLPDAHTEAPAGGSVILAALLLKLGGYGFLRFSLPITPDASEILAWPMMLLSLIAISYIGFVAIVQTDMKKLIAYSSIAHMGFVTLGCFVIYTIYFHSHDYKDAYMGIEGGMVQMISHAFSSGAMFVAVGVLYDQMHTRLIKDYGGVVNSMPIFASFFMLFAMANVGLPGTSGFVGEFMVVLSAFQVHFWVAFVAASTLILAAAYTLWMYKRVFFGEIVHQGVSALKDIDARDTLVFALLGGMVLLFGFFPNLLLNVFHPTVGHLLEQSLHSKLPLV